MNFSADDIQNIGLVVTMASAVCAALPAPKTRVGKAIRRIIEALALNIGHAKKQ